MILYPAIDLKDGQCVRVVHGDPMKIVVGSAVLALIKSTSIEVLGGTTPG